MSKKKKIIVISSILSLLVIIAIISIAIVLKPKDKKVEEKDEKVVENVQEEIKYKDEIVITLEDELPKIEDYIISGTIEESSISYKSDNDEDVNLEELKIGTYKVFINDSEIGILKIIDETKPELKLNEVTINENAKYKAQDFVKSCVDNSKEDCIISFKEEEMSKYTKEGTYDIEIIAKDSSENEITAKTKLIIKKKSVQSNNPVGSSSNNNNESNSNAYETSQTTETYKYGTKIITSGKKTTYDYSTFNGTTNDMKAEASSLVTSNASIYNEVLNNTNVYRNEVGASPLTLNNELSLGATIRAIEIAYSDKFSHTRPDGSSFNSVLDQINYTSWGAVGENIAYSIGYSTYSPVQVCESWKNSPGHYANMISESYSLLGVGYYKLGNKIYYVQIFGG